MSTQAFKQIEAEAGDLLRLPFVQSAGLSFETSGRPSVVVRVWEDSDESEIGQVPSRIGGYDVVLERVEHAGFFGKRARKRSQCRTR